MKRAPEYPINAAIRELKWQCRDTFQTFADRFGLSGSAVQKYCKDRIPEPRIIVLFLRGAMAHRRNDLAEIFDHCLAGGRLAE